MCCVVFVDIIPLTYSECIRFDVLYSMRCDRYAVNRETETSNADYIPMPIPIGFPIIPFGCPIPIGFPWYGAFPIAR